MFISWYLISYSFALHVVMFLFFFTFLCECACMCSHSMCVQRARLCVCVQWVCHSAKHWTCCWQATVCGFSSWSCCSGGREWCVPPKPPAPPPIISRPTHSLLSLLSFSWAPVPGLWPVDECYILAVSTGVSWGLACGGSAVSGPVCQLLVPLPPAPQCWLGCSQWHKHTVTDSLA